VRVPCGDLGPASQAGVLIANVGSPEAIVNPLTGQVRARVSGALYPIHDDLALTVPPQGSAQWHRLSLMHLSTGQRRSVGWPSYFGDLIRVAIEPHGPLVAVDFGSPAYPGPAQAEDIWMLDTATGEFTHLPGYPAQVDIKFSDIVWTNDDRLVIAAQGGGRTVVGIWTPGQATLRVRSVPTLQGYLSFVPLGA